MKFLTIALKDLKHALSTPFALVMMFGAPLLITGLMFFAFGGLSSDGESIDMQAVRVQVVNLDQPGENSSGLAAGEMLVDFLRSEDLTDLLMVQTSENETAARQAVDDQQADVALIIPQDFTNAAMGTGEETAVTLYKDPTQTIGPGIVEDLVKQFTDAFAGSRITAGVTLEQLQTAGVPGSSAIAGGAASRYAAWLDESGHDHDQAAGDSAILQTLSPSGDENAQGDLELIIGTTMAAMTIFFAFFMAGSSAESIIREDEAGTLGRLFTTPTRVSMILTGKFTAVVLTLVVQVVVLLVSSSLIFNLSWGEPLPLLLATTGLIVVAAGFGILLMSFIRNTRQTGPVLGGVLTVTSLLGGLFTSGIPNVPDIFDTFRLVMPQGWAMETWELLLRGAGADEVFLPVTVMLAMGAVFFAIGVYMFNRRFS